MKTTTVMVVYDRNGGFEWTKVGVGSYREHFDEPLLVVDHNNNPNERKFLKAHGCHIIPQGRGRQHGDGLDTALRWCRKHGTEVMIAIEPDCLITGRKWHTALTDAIDEGAWMASTFRRSHGPLHPCPSAWRVDKVRHSFNTVPKGMDAKHPKLAEVFSLRRLIDSLSANDHNEAVCRFCVYMWDTAFKNWFEMAVRGKATHVFLENPDFIHLWHGSETAVDLKNPLYGKYLNPLYGKYLKGIPHL